MSRPGEHVDTMVHGVSQQHRQQKARRSRTLRSAQHPRQLLIPVASITIALCASARLYPPKKLLLMILIGVLVVTADRALTYLAGRFGLGAQRAQAAEGHPPAPSPHQTAASGAPAPNRPGGPGPGRPRHLHAVMSPIPDENLRPLAFVQQTAIGSLPWQLPRIPAQSGVAADQAMAGPLAVRAASIVGAGHRYDGDRAGPRQDSYQLGLDGRRTHLLVAVADGVSGASYSETGARLATFGAVQAMRRLMHDPGTFDQHTAGQVFQQVAYGIRSTAEQERHRPGDYATTLIVAAIPLAPSNPAGDRRVWLGWLADSTAWLFDPGGWRQLTGAQKEGYDRNTLDACLPERPEQVRSALVDFPAGRALALMTDGLGDTLTDVDGAKEELAKRWAAPPSLPAFLRDLCFDAPGQDDDRTAVVVWSPPSGRGR